MKGLLYGLMLLSSTPCIGQIDSVMIFNLAISPSVDKSNIENQKVIHVLESFLKSKNSSITENEYWLNSDFDKYVYPYLDIYQIEKSRYGANYFKPSLMELISVSENEKLLKIAFIGVNSKTREAVVRCIYNIIAIKEHKGWKLKKATDYQTRYWTTKQVNSIFYKFPPGKEGDQAEIDRQALDIQNLSAFFEISPIPITYYSCYSPKQIFEVKGFDYLSNMYFSKTGGMADKGNIIYSGNNSEYYTHEIVHVYVETLFTNIHGLLNEGIATYIGGSGKHDYKWHRQNFKTYLDTSHINLAVHTNPYEKLYVNEETLIPYMVGALICERTYRLYGKKKLFKLLDAGTDIWIILNEFGLTPKNLTEEIIEELKLSPTLYR